MPIEGNFNAGIPRVAPYVGPGDVVPNATVWWGLRGYSAAVSNGITKSVNLRASGDNATSDFVILPNGNLDTASISAFQLAHGGNLFVTALYDQSESQLYHVTQSTAANQPQFLLTGGPNSKPTILFVKANSLSLNIGGDATVTVLQNQPFTMVAAASNTATTQAALISGASNGFIQWGFALSGTANQMFSYAQSSLPTVTCADNTFHAIMSIFSDAAVASAMVVNGVSTLGSLGSTTGFGTFNGFSLGGSGSTVFFDGSCSEAGIWPITYSGTQVTNVNSNERNYWGF